MGETVGRIDDPGRQEAYRHPGPVEAHHHLGVEIHALTETPSIQQFQGRGQRVDPKTAHAVADFKGGGLQPDPDMGDIATVETPLRHRLVIDGSTGDQRLGMQPRLGQQTRHIGQIVLTVGIQLQGMGKTQSGRLTQPLAHGAPLPLIERQSQQGNPSVACHQLVEQLGRLGAATVIDDKTRQQGFIIL